jgi:DNA-binding transcriptional MocR family regulator
LEANVATPDRFLVPDPPLRQPEAKANTGLFSFARSEPAPATRARHLPAATERLCIPKFDNDPTIPSPLSRIDIATTLQYGQATGIAPLHDFIKEFSLKHLHGGKIPYSDPGPEILLTCGSTDGFSKIMNTFGERGDSLLVEGFTYMNAIQTARPLGIGIVPIKMDAGGMTVEGEGGLRDVLENWDTVKQGRKPHLMYTIT